MPGHDAWWVIHGEELAKALHRVKDGEDPDLIYTELFANSEHEEVEGER